MAKKTKTTVPIVNRRTLSRREREERYRRWLYISAGLFAALILGIVAVGFYQVRIAEPASPVAVVNGKVIRTDTYQRWVQYRRQDLRASLAQLEEQLRQFDPNDQQQQAIYNYLAQQQQQMQIQAASLPNSALEELIDDELIRQEAARRGLAVTPDEVQREIEKQLGYNVPPPTPEPTVPVTATAPISGTPAPTSTPAPTPTPMTKERFDELYRNGVQRWQKSGFTEADFRGLVQTGLLRDRLQTALAAAVPTATEQIHARHILVEKEEDAKAALDRIKKGEDFAKVAQAVSTDTSTKDKGGDLGWFPRGQMMSEFDKAAFALQPGQVSDLVQTAYGFHIIKVEERDPNRPLDEAALAQKRSQALDDWLATQRTASGVERHWSSDKVPKDTETSTP